MKLYTTEAALSMSGHFKSMGFVRGARTVFVIICQSLRTAFEMEAIIIRDQSYPQLYFYTIISAHDV